MRDRRPTCPSNRSGLRSDRSRLLCPLLTSRVAITRLAARSVRFPGHAARSPEVRSTAFTARPPDLPPRSLMAVDFAIICPLVRPGRPRYPVLVHRVAALLHASFRPRLATTPLRFANPSPPSGWVEDFHLQAVDHARHTKKDRQLRRSLRTRFVDSLDYCFSADRRLTGSDAALAKAFMPAAETSAIIRS